MTVQWSIGDTARMSITEFLRSEWREALGCTEPVAIAYAASLAATQSHGEVRTARLRCDPRMFKNCFAVGIPGSGHRIGIRWALALGALLPDPSLELRCFRAITPEIIKQAEGLLQRRSVQVEVAEKERDLLVEVEIERASGSGRVVIRGEHTRVVELERDGVAQPSSLAPSTEGALDVRAELAKSRFADLIAVARSLGPSDREALRRGMEMNLAISRHGLSLFPKSFVEMAGDDPLSRISRLVCAGVYARMWGEDLSVMSLSGSGNKGIVCAVPLALWGKEKKVEPERVEEALALACLVTSATTHHLGALSAVCGCSNAAGIGLAAGLCLLEGGGEREVSLAINNMVGNVTGMICDGAKIGCALKTMTAVDAAFRSCLLALSGIGIPESDGIVGADGLSSLRNLGRMAGRGMQSADAEILSIMREKLV